MNKYYKEELSQRWEALSFKGYKYYKYQVGVDKLFYFNFKENKWKLSFFTTKNIETRKMIPIDFEDLPYEIRRSESLFEDEDNAANGFLL